MATMKELEDALSKLEELFPGEGIMLTVFNADNGETVANRSHAAVASVVTGLYINRVVMPTSKDTIQ